MKIVSKHRCTARRPGRSLQLFLLVALVALGVVCVPAGQGLAAVVAQAPANPVLQFLPSFDRSADQPLREHWIYLDGRPLFQVRADIRSIEQRRRDIQMALDETVDELLSSDPTPVHVDIREQSDFPVIYLNDRYIMTVLESDAQLAQMSPRAWAEQVKRQLQKAVRQGRRERQPAVRRQAMERSIAALVLAVLATIAIKGVRRWSRRIDRRSCRIEPAQELLNERLREKRRDNWRALRDLGLNVATPLLWLVTGTMVAGWFPTSRPIQVWITGRLSTYGGLGAIALATYVSVRLSFVAIDQFVAAVLTGSRLSSRVPVRLQQRVFTISSIFKSVTAVTLAIVGVLVALVFLGVDVGPLVAGASLIGVAISLASQSLIKDAINGFLILVEDQYAVGDVIVVKADEIHGLVENITLRVTQLRDPEQRLITIPNSEIRIVSNLSSHRSQADIKIPIAYGSNLDRALEQVEAVSNSMEHDPVWRDIILSAPQMLGVDEFSATGLMVRVWIETLPLKQWDVAREFRRRLKLAFDREGIAMAKTQTEVWFHDGNGRSRSAAHNSDQGNHLGDHRGGDRRDHPVPASASSPWAS